MRKPLCLPISNSRPPEVVDRRQAEVRKALFLPPAERAVEEAGVQLRHLSEPAPCQWGALEE